MKKYILPIVKVLIITTLIISTGIVYRGKSYLAFAKTSKKLKVPFIMQEYAMLCGPTCIDMIFRYWGETRFNKLDITAAILKKYAGTGRYKIPTILEKEPVQWGKYPGTGTSTMREFLKQFARVDNKRKKYIPDNRIDEVGEEFFNHLKSHIDNGVPVIVHQYSRRVGSGGHYRIVTGYDDNKKIVYLNDPAKGRITWSYDRFMKMWNVKEPWLQFNSIAFNTSARKNIKIKINKYRQKKNKKMEQIIPEYRSVIKEPLRNTIVKESIIKLINSIKPDYYNLKKWKKRLNKYYKELQYADHPYEMGSLIAVLENFILWRAITDKQSWKIRRKQWKKELRAASDLGVVKKLLLELEINLKTASVSSEFMQNRKSWRRRLK